MASQKLQVWIFERVSLCLTMFPLLLLLPSTDFYTFLMEIAKEENPRFIWFLFVQNFSHQATPGQLVGLWIGLNVVYSVVPEVGWEPSSSLQNS